MGRYGFIWKVALAAALAAQAPAQDELTSLYSEAQKAQSAGDLATATSKYEAIVRLRPQMAEAYANLGNLYYQQGLPTRAKPVYQKAIQLKPDLAGPHFFLGVMAFSARDYSAALKSLQRAQQLQPENPLIPAYLGYTQYGRSAFHEAAGELEKAAALDRSDIDVLYHLGKAYSHLAQAAFDKLNRAFPKSAFANLARAHAYEIQENWEAAGEQYKLALATMPGNARLEEKARWAAAKAANASEATDAGVSHELVDGSMAYRDAPLSGPKLAEELGSWQSRVHALEREATSDRQAYSLAEGYQVLSYLSSLAVFELDSNSYRAHQLKAQFLETSNKDEDAIAEYRIVLKQRPDLPNIHFAIGSLYWKDQRFGDARPELLQELKMNPNHPEALYEMGDMASFEDDLQSAEKYFVSALKLNPSMVEAHFALEKIYTQSGRYEKSLEQLKKALEIDSTDPTAHYRLAGVYRKLGRIQDANRELAIFAQNPAAIQHR